MACGRCGTNKRPTAPRVRKQRVVRKVRRNPLRNRIGR